MQYPTKNEYTSFFSTYMSHLPTRCPVALLEQTLHYQLTILSQVNEEQRYEAYQEGKWTIYQVVKHILDAEVMLGYRALRFARNDSTNIEFYDEDAYVSQSLDTNGDWDLLIQSFDHLRRYHIHFFKSLSEEESKRGGSDNFPCTVRALCAIISAHAIHHLYVIQSKYLKKEINYFI